MERVPRVMAIQGNAFSTSSNDGKEENAAAKRRRDPAAQTTQEIFAFVTDSTLRELIWSLNEDQARKLKDQFLSNQFARFEVSRNVRVRLILCETKCFGVGFAAN